MADSKRGKRKSKLPSREKYEREHPTISFRLDEETHQRLKEYLGSTNRSSADFVKDAIGREEPMIGKRIQAWERQLAALKDEQRCHRDLIRQAHHLIQIAGRGNALPDPVCPRCGKEMIFLWVKEVGAGPNEPELFTYACECGCFINSYKGIAPSSIRSALHDEDGGGS